jgi:hypothetical protein
MVYPNPTSNILTISGFSSTSEMKFTILSLEGEQVLTKILNGDQNIYVSALSSGMYFIQITSEGISEVIKLIKK